MDTVMGWKLFRQRRDGSLGPLFINQRQRLEVGGTYVAEDHPTKGYAHRPGWHLCAERSAPHLREQGRVWVRVLAQGITPHQRPARQGGLWFTAKKITILGIDGIN